MSDIKEQKEEIMKKLELVTSQVTEETIKNASTEDLKEYLRLMTEITIRLINLDGKE